MDLYDAKIRALEPPLEKLEELVSWTELCARQLLFYDPLHYLDIRTQCEALFARVEKVAATTAFLRKEGSLWNTIQLLRFRLDLAGVEILHHSNHVYDDSPLAWGYRRYMSIDLQESLFVEVGFGFVSLLTTLYQQLKTPALGRHFIEREVDKNPQLVKQPRNMFEYLVKRARSDVHSMNTREVEQQLKWLENQAPLVLDPITSAYNLSVVRRLSIEHELFRSSHLGNSRASAIADELQGLGGEALNRDDFKMLKVITTRGLVRLHILSGDFDQALQEALVGELQSSDAGFCFPIEQYRFRSLINMIMGAQASSLARNNLQEWIRVQRNF